MSCNQQQRTIFQGVKNVVVFSTPYEAELVPSKAPEVFAAKKVSLEGRLTEEVATGSAQDGVIDVEEGGSFLCLLLGLGLLRHRLSLTCDQADHSHPAY